MPKLPEKRLILLARAPDHTYSSSQLNEIIKNTCGLVNKTTAKQLTWLLCSEDKDIYRTITQIILLMHQQNYTFTQFKSSARKPKAGLDRELSMSLVVSAAQQKTAKLALNHAIAIAQSSNLVKDLANTPPNICDPAYLAAIAKKLSKGNRQLKVTVKEKKQLEQLKMHSFLSVAKGSIKPPKLICIEYYGTKRTTPPIALVGKGVTFDTGGNSLKPSASMVGMKYDMCGAATVLGIMHLAKALALPLNLIGVIPATENMPGGTASRPDDVVTSMSGITIEILNTDAEGRLILCDALTYTKKFKPELIIDIATLTGACIIALGSHHSGLFSNDDVLANQLLAAGQQIGDKAWRLPLGEEYHKMIESEVADIANIGNTSGAGSIVGAVFLERFVNDVAWAHLDVAGTAHSEGKNNRSATARPLPLLANFLLKKAKLLPYK